MSHHSEAYSLKPQLLQRLKTDTRSQHRRVEEIFTIMSPELTLQKYRFWLGKLYGYYAPLESALDAYALKTTLKCDYRSKTALLRQDLSHLGLSEVEIQQLPLCQHLPEITTVSHFLGVLYVLEGATLGGSIIANHLSKNPALDVLDSVSFFLPYGRNPLPHWQAFQKQLLELSESAHIDTLISTACMTFDSMSDWLAKQ